jgi:hypothetical protein
MEKPVEFPEFGPTTKAPAIESLISRIAGGSRPQTIRSRACMLCKDPDTNFRNSRSEREYTISGMCQKCQDRMFGED